MSMTTYPGGIGTTNAAWWGIVSALAADDATAALADRLTAYLSDDPTLYVEIDATDAEIAAIDAVLP